MTDTSRAEGYAWGSLGHGYRNDYGDAWLTILGSALRDAPLTERPEDAEIPATVLLRDGKPQPYTLAKVRRLGRTFAVIDTVGTHTPALPGASA
ncbi:hypothetical protein ABTY20_19155 [Streptomyces sp. NPDC126497]|uniref:hypothetical protein n=1 Tax=Streptomyces sp. NPDC126497 TaxID=3155313 RepID=UPI00332EA142